MNPNFEKELRAIHSVSMDPGNAHADHYMRGMANGIELVLATYENREPNYIEADKVREPQEYHDLAMRTAAGSEVFHYPPEGSELRGHIDEAIVSDIRWFLIVAARLDDWKSRLFYNKPKYARIHDEVGTTPPFPEYINFDRWERSLAFIENPQMIHAILGIASEAGEILEDFAEIMRGEERQSYADEPPHGPHALLNMARETGDIDWFQELLAKAINMPVSDTRHMNIERLKGRFPEKFSTVAALARADEATES